MFEKILVPLDGSSLSEQALPAAKSLLESGVSQATLFAAGDAPKATGRRRAGPRSAVAVTGAPTGSFVADVIPGVPPAYAENPDQAIERREHELLEYLQRAGQPLVETGKTVDAVVHFGHAAEEIIAAAEGGGYDLIVMATHGRSGLRATLQGSVTAAVIRSGVCPVLVIRPKDSRKGKKP